MQWVGQDVHIADGQTFCQADEYGNSFKGNAGETSERWGGAHMGLSKHIDTIEVDVLAMSTFSPVGSLSSNGLRMRV